MKKKKLILTICLTVIVILSSLTLVYANNTDGGYTSKVGSASNETWGYDVKGIRLALYAYDGVELTYYGAVDYCAKKGSSGTMCPNGNKAYQTESKAGKVAYIAGKAKSGVTMWSNEYVTISANAKDFNCAYGGTDDSCSWDKLRDEIIDYFSLDSKDNNEIIGKIKANFNGLPNVSGLTESKLPYLYLTVEPTYRIFYSSPTGKTGLRYGTAYEIAKYVNGNNYNGLNKHIYIGFPESILAESRDKIDDYGFVDKFMPLVGNIATRKSCSADNGALRYLCYQTNNVASKQNLMATMIEPYGFGINAFWFGQYTSKPKTPSCTISSSGNTYTLNLQNTEGLKYDYGINGYTYNFDASSSSKLSGFLFNSQKSYTANSRDVKIVGAIKTSDNQIYTCQLQREVPTCQSTCSGKTGDDLLACAESFCQANSTNTTEKTNCMIACPTTPPPGWNPPFSACSSPSNTDGTGTVCDDNTSGSTKTCVPASTSTYFKRECEEKSTITYGNSLPTTLLPGTGFSYTPTLSGSKTCTMTFEVDKWKWDYARSYTQDERNSLLDKLNAYNNTNDNSMWKKDTNDWYTYHSEDADIKIEIETDKESNTVTKTLVVNDTINDNGISVSTGGSKTFAIFGNGGKTNKTVYGTVKTTSSNKTIYRLPAVCIAGATSGEVYSPDQNGNCKKENDGPYNDYFTDMMLSSGTYNTKVTVNKSSSNLNANDFSNTCHYNVDNDPKTPYCTISKLDDGSYRLNIFNNVKGLTYGISDKENTINNSLIFKPTSTTTKIYGTLKKGDTIIDTCPVELNPPGNPPGDPSGNPPDNPGDQTTCSALYKPTQYSAIKTYCNANWYNDTANYLSAKDCYNKCSNGDEEKNPTCKVNTEFVCDEKEKVENYCKSNYAKDGYNSVGSCINDCYCSITIPDVEICEDCDPPIFPGDNNNNNDDCLGITCDYIYRPISLRDPFPKNRMPGYNWIGKEVYITDDLENPVLNSSANPEYVIELTPNRIKSIKADTKRYNMGKGKNAYIDYVYKNEYNQDGKYESKFIHVNDPNSGGFYSYFTIIEGNGV